jgi:3-oxoacyl-[acyl-carrier-protein] synthase-3
MSAYITGLGVCLPNKPVTNDRIEAVLGSTGSQSSAVKELILARNGIRSRHYAIDPDTLRQTHTNAQLTAEAVRALVESSGLSPDDIEVLACGTSTPDQLIPSHASMVHGLVGCAPCELVSPSGVCCSGMAALKYGYLSVHSGASRNAVVTGSDLPSPGLVARYYHSQRASNGQVEREPYAAFDHEFLRWMLSDGAGAVLIEGRPRPGAVSLRIDWLDMISFANELETCMYLGAQKAEDGSLRTWRELDNVDHAWSDGYFTIAQDVRLLKDNILPVAMRRSLEWVRKRRGLKAEQIDWLLPHLSSYFFHRGVLDVLSEMDFRVPPEKWFTNLAEKGNTGAASVFVMLEELCASGRLRPGDRVLCAVPESARFTFAYMHLTAGGA